MSSAVGICQSCRVGARVAATREMMSIPGGRNMSEIPDGKSRVSVNACCSAGAGSQAVMLYIPTSAVDRPIPATLPEGYGQSSSNRLNRYRVARKGRQAYPHQHARGAPETHHISDWAD